MHSGIPRVVIARLDLLRELKLLLSADQLALQLKNPLQADHHFLVSDLRFCAVLFHLVRSPFLLDFLPRTTCQDSLVRIHLVTPAQYKIKIKTKITSTKPKV